MSSSFAIQYKWLRKGRTKEPERASQADISILVNDVNLTHNTDLLHVISHDFARLSALHLSMWFADNWWRLLWEPDSGSRTPEWQMRHNIGAAGGGYVWPNLSFISDWNTISVHGTPTVPRAAEPIYYTRDYHYFVSASSFEQGIDDFVNATIDKLAVANPSYTDIGSLWNEVVEERNDHEVSQWRKLEACLGYDPDEAPEGLLEGLRREYSRYGTNAIHELAAGSGNQTVNHLRDVVEDVETHGSTVQSPQYQEIRKGFAERSLDPNALPWQRAVQAAKTARQVWGLGDGPIQSNTLGDIFGISLDEPSGGGHYDMHRAPFSVGIRSDKSEEGFRVSLHQRHLYGRRFTLTRLVGDYIAAQQDEPLMPATHVTTSRQKFQRAFAQEFLCPWDELAYFFSGKSLDSENFDEAAEYFQVSSWVVTRTLVNHGWLDRDRILGDFGV